MENFKRWKTFIEHFLWVQFVDRDRNAWNKQSSKFEVREYIVKCYLYRFDTKHFVRFLIVIIFVMINMFNTCIVRVANKELVKYVNQSSVPYPCYQ